MGLPFSETHAETIVGSRTLHLDGRSKAICISIFLPYPNDGDYVCRFRIVWPDRSESGVCRGTDSIQAMLLAMKKTDSMVRSSAEAQDGRIGWSASDPALAQDSRAWPAMGA